MRVLQDLLLEGYLSKYSAQMMMAASGMQPAMMPGAMPSMAGSAAPAHELMQQMHMQRVREHVQMELLWVPSYSGLVFAEMSVRY